MVTPDLNFNGNLTVPVLINDGLEDSATFDLLITIEPVNDAPLSELPIGDQQAVENSLFQLDISPNFTDVDGDTLTFSAAGLPASGNISLDTQNGMLSGTPDFDDAQDFPYDVTITATDSSNETASDTFPFTVAALGRANVGLVISATPDPAMLSDEVQWTFTAGNTGPESATSLQLDGIFVGQNLTVAAVGATVCTIQSAVGQAGSP